MILPYSKYEEIRNYKKGTTCKVYLIDNYIHKVYKKQYKKDYYRDLEYIKKLNQYDIDFIPKLIDYRKEDLIMVITYCGIPLNHIKHYNFPNDAKEQIEKICTTLRKYDFYHGDIYNKNVCIKDNKIYLIDLGGGRNIKECNKDKEIRKIKNKLCILFHTDTNNNLDFFKIGLLIIFIIILLQIGILKM